MAQLWTLRPATEDDASWLADLKVLAMRPDLERLGLWDRAWARQRFLDKFFPANTDVIEIDGKPVGVIAVRPERDAQWIEHFYLHPSVSRSRHRRAGPSSGHGLPSRRQTLPARDRSGQQGAPTVRAARLCS
jgi:hypothetical protein